MKRNIKDITILIHENRRSFIPIVELCKKTSFYKTVKKTNKSIKFVNIPNNNSSNFSVKLVYDNGLFDIWTIPSDVILIPKWVKKHLKRWGFCV